jgi:hypothetical protein
MLQKRRVGRSRKALALERLEDRVNLSGNVLAFQNALLGNGVLNVVGDNGNNCIAINQTNNLGFPTLTVTGSSTTTPIIMGNVTAVNSIAGGSFNVPLSSVTSIKVTLGTGTDCVLVGNLHGFSIPGNIIITLGAAVNGGKGGFGVDTVSLTNISVNSGQIQIVGSGTTTETITETNVIAGSNYINFPTNSAAGIPPSGKLTLTQTNVTMGFDVIRAGNADNNITIQNSRFAPPPRSYAIGQLDLAAGNGKNTLTVNNVLAGLSNIVLGNGNNTVAFTGSTIQAANIVIGTETANAAGNNTVNISNDIITGKPVTAFMIGAGATLFPGLNLRILNQYGVNGFTETGGMAPAKIPGNTNSPPVVNNVTMNNLQFQAGQGSPGGGNLNLRVDDGGSYVNAGNNVNVPGSMVVMTLVDTSGNVAIVLGDNMQLAELGQGTAGLNDIDAGNLSVTVGNGLDVVIVSAIVADDEAINLGDLFGTGINSGGGVGNVPLPMPPSITINGSSEETHINLGDNGNTTITGLPVDISLTVFPNDNGSDSGLIIGGNVVSAGTFPPHGTLPGTAQGGFPANFTPTPISNDADGNGLPDGLAVNLHDTVVAGTTGITLGSGGVKHFESLTVNKLVTSDLYIILHSNGPTFNSDGSIASPGDVPDTVPAGVFVTLNNVQVLDSTPLFTPIVGGMFPAGTTPPTGTAASIANFLLWDLGQGVDIVSLANVNVVYGMDVLLSTSNMNVLSAQNVTSAFGQIDGGAPGTGNIYEDLGGNFGYFVSDFIGHQDP